MKKNTMPFAVFTAGSCLVSAFCLSLLCYTYYTGELMFNFKPVIPKPEDVKAKGEPQKDMLDDEARKFRAEDEAVQAFYGDLVLRQKQLEDKEKLVADRERQLKAIESNIKLLLEQAREENQTLQSSLEQIDLREMENIREQSLILAEIEPKAAAKIILQWENDPSKNRLGRFAPRVLYFMDKKKAGAIFQAIINSGEADALKRAKELQDAMRVLTPELKKE